MKDLFVFVADADAQAVIKTILERPDSLQIRPITFMVDRHTMRDSGMVTDGPELIRLRLKKDDYARVLLIWDHEGSGKPDVKRCAADVRARLEMASWRDRSEAVAIVPELEEWVWHNVPAIAKLLGISEDEVERIKVTCSPGALITPKPKDLFEAVVYRCLRRKPLPADFEKIARSASLVKWQSSESFRRIVTVLREWFPRSD